MSSIRSWRSWLPLAALVVALGGGVAGCGGEGDACDIVCGCVKQQYGDGAACLRECRRSIETAPAGERETTCEAQLTSDGFTACVDRCSAFQEEEGGTGSCDTVCQCVERQYGEGSACLEQCQATVTTAPRGEQRLACETVLITGDYLACLDRCSVFGDAVDTGCPCTSAACDFCWCGTELENACPEDFRGTSDGCDCGCQWSDPDC